MSAEPGDITIASHQRMLDLIERHRVAELEHHDADETLSTMVDNPYLYYAAARSGGDGYTDVHRFYSSMVKQLPDDMQWDPISRVIGSDQIVIESILKFTHNVKMDWLLPGVLPTGRFVEIPMVIVFSFDAGKLLSERIYWDQASTLVQLGLLRSEGLPVAGAESPRRLRELVAGRHKHLT